MLGGDRQCHLCLHRVLVDQAENHAIHLLSFFLPPSSAFPTSVLEQAAEPFPFALRLHLTIWRPSCSHRWVLALPCCVFQAFSAISAHAGTFQPLQNTQTKHGSCIHQLTQLLVKQYLYFVVRFCCLFDNKNCCGLSPADNYHSLSSANISMPLPGAIVFC